MILLIVAWFLLLFGFKYPVRMCMQPFHYWTSNYNMDRPNLMHNLLKMGLKCWKYYFILFFQELLDLPFSSLINVREGVKK